MRDIGDINDVRPQLVQNASRSAMLGLVAVALIFGGILYYRARR